MSFPINIAIPDGPNDPADDQPLIKGNFVSINSLFSVDLVDPGAIGNGFHKQSTYLNFNVPGVSPTDPTGIAFTGAGIALASAPQYYFINSQATFPLSALKAFGQFPVAVAAPVMANSYNIASTAFTVGPLAYQITLTANTVFGNNVIVLLNTNRGGVLSYTFVGGVLNITPGTGVAVADLINFAIIQI